MFNRIQQFLIVTVMTTALTLVSSSVKAETLFGDYLKEKGLDVEVSAATDFYNKYVWRGFLLDGDPVIQPSVTIAVGPFEGGFWGSWDVSSDDSLEGDEVDGWIGYNFDLGFLDESFSIVGVSVGHTWYHFPDGDTGLADGSQSKEFYLTVSLDTFLSPYVSWYHDYGSESSGGGDGDYLMVGVGHSIDLIEDYGVTLDLGFEVGYNNEAFIEDDGGYTLSTVGLTIPLTDHLTMAPVIAYSSPFGDIGEANDDEFYVGVSVGYAL